MKFLEHIQVNPAVSLTKGEAYPFIEMANVGSYKREPCAVDYKVFNSGVKFQKFDTVVARIEPCLQNGKGFFCKNIEKGFGSTEFLVFRPKDEEVDSIYLYYLMQSEYVRKSMIGSMTGATGRQRVNNEIFQSLEFNLPPVKIQTQIADILSAYDDLIENNQKQIKLLDEAAQRLYKEWFIDLHFPGHDTVPIVNGIPEGWEKVTLKDYVPIITGKKDANYGTIGGRYPFFTCGQEPIKAPAYSFDANAVILAGNGDFNVKLYRGKFEAYQRTYVLLPYDIRNLYILFHVVQNNMTRLVSGASGSTIKFLTKGMIEAIPMMIPDNETLLKYNSINDGIQQQIEVAKQKINLANEARDRLLPQLMSGRMEV